MYKGYKRKVIVVKDTGSSLFDSAYFVVREGASERGIHDMVNEASKIINEKISEEACPDPYKRFLAFSMGISLSAVLFSITVAFFT